MPSSLSIHSSAPETKIIFQFLWRILEDQGTAIPAHSEKWHFFTCGWNLKIFGPNHFIWSAMKVPFCDFIQNVPQAPSMCISMLIKWINGIISKIPHFVLGLCEYLERLEGKIRKCLFFYFKIFLDNSVGTHNTRVPKGKDTQGFYISRKERKKRVLVWLPKVLKGSYPT